MISLHSCQAHVIMYGWKILCPLERLKAWVVSVVEISAIEGVWSRRSDNGTVTVTFRTPTPSAEPIRPVDRISIEAMDDIDQFAVPGGEGSWGSEGYGYRPIVAPPRPDSFYGGYFNYRYYP